MQNIQDTFPKIKYWNRNQLKADCRWPCSDDNGWYCYKRINALQIIQDSPCNECSEYKKEERRI